MKIWREGYCCKVSRNVFRNRKGHAVLCCSRKGIVWLRDIVREYDKQAFLIVSDVKEVFGEGFIEDISSK